MGSKPITRAYSSYSAGDGSEWCSPSVIGDLNNLDLHNAASATLDSVHLPTPSKRNSRTLSAATINESDISMSDLSGEASLHWSDLPLQIDLNKVCFFLEILCKVDQTLIFHVGDELHSHCSATILCQQSVWYLTLMLKSKKWDRFQVLEASMPLMLLLDHLNGYNHDSLDNHSVVSLRRHWHLQSDVGHTKL